jgi:hypothetical protein
MGGRRTEVERPGQQVALVLEWTDHAGRETVTVEPRERRGHMETLLRSRSLIDAGMSPLWRNLASAQPRARFNMTSA